MQAAAIVLGLAAVGSLTLATNRMMGTPRPPTWMALGHGVVALIGLGLLIKEANNPGIPQLAQVALAVILLAALGGQFFSLGFTCDSEPSRFRWSSVMVSSRRLSTSYSWSPFPCIKRHES